jgi:hypothetical protein
MAPNAQESASVAVDGRDAQIRRPDLVGALLGKAAAAAKISSQCAASRAKNLRDFDSLARLLGVADRQGAELTKSERQVIVALVATPDVYQLGAAALRLLADEGTA